MIGSRASLRREIIGAVRTAHQDAEPHDKLITILSWHSIAGGSVSWTTRL